MGSDAACLLLVAKDMVALNCTLQDMVAVDFWWDRAHGIPSGLFTCSGQRHGGSTVLLVVVVPQFFRHSTNMSKVIVCIRLDAPTM